MGVQHQRRAHPSAIHSTARITDPRAVSIKVDTPAHAFTSSVKTSSGPTSFLAISTTSKRSTAHLGTAAVFVSKWPGGPGRGTGARRVHAIRHALPSWPEEGAGKTSEARAGQGVNLLSEEASPPRARIVDSTSDKNEQSRVTQPLGARDP